MYCERCGEELKDDALFCENCGTKVPQQSEATKEVAADDFSDQQSESKPDTSGVDVSAYPTAVQPPVGAPVFSATTPMSSVENGEKAAPEPIGQERKKKLKKPFIIAVVAAVIVLIAAIVLVVSFVFGSSDQESQDSGAEPIRGYTSVQEMENAKNAQNDETNSEQNEQSGSNDRIEEVLSGPHGYILPESDTRYYSENELNALTDYQLYLARNEIYARHGREFKNQDLQNYFKNKDWYTGRYSPDSFDSIVTLNDFEKKNAAAMLAIEKRRGSSYLMS